MTSGEEDLNPYKPPLTADIHHQNRWHADASFGKGLFLGGLAGCLFFAILIFIALIFAFISTFPVAGTTDFVAPLWLHPQFAS